MQANADIIIDKEILGITRKSITSYAVSEKGEANKSITNDVTRKTEMS